MGWDFPKSRRLRKRSDFLLLQNPSVRVGSAHFLLLLRVRPDELTARLGVTVTRRYGNAVARNRLKRLVREAFRQNPDLVPNGTDLVVVAKTGVERPVGLSVVAGELLGAAGRLHRQAARLRGELAKMPNRTQTGSSSESSSS